jgi:Uncharacterized conserved protein, contains double-stranded beta-helix domain
MISRVWTATAWRATSSLSARIVVRRITFSGVNNVRSNYVLHYILDGQGTFSSANRPAVSLKQGDVFLLPKDVPCFYQADGEHPWTYLWIGFAGAKG